MFYRTKTYIAADWDGDYQAVKQLYKWEKSLSFKDAHSITQARDDSLNCSIKLSLDKRLNASKTFVLIVGSNTKTVRNGRCQYCNSYNSWTGGCARGHSIDNKSYIEYECKRAIEDKLKIIVLYNSASVDKSKCPDVIKYMGRHVAMCTYENGKYYWNYQAVKNALS